ncbi:unnamed protein product [Bubo scandiacus]
MALILKPYSVCLDCYNCGNTCDESPPRNGKPRKSPGKLVYNFADPSEYAHQTTQATPIMNMDEDYTIKGLGSVVCSDSPRSFSGSGGLNSPGGFNSGGGFGGSGGFTAPGSFNRSRGFNGSSGFNGSEGFNSSSGFNNPGSLDGSGGGSPSTSCCVHKKQNCLN